MLNLDETNFRTVVKKNKFIAIDFFAEWCQPCQYMKPVFSGLEKDFKGKIAFANVDIEASPVLAEEFGVMSIPCIVVFKDGEEQQRITGMTEATELAAEFQEVLKRK